jgi:hypothetical protein
MRFTSDNVSADIVDCLMSFGHTGNSAVQWLNRMVIFKYEDNQSTEYALRSMVTR